jgi:hypothetical protein
MVSLSLPKSVAKVAAGSLPVLGAKLRSPLPAVARLGYQAFFLLPMVKLVMICATGHPRVRSEPP